MRFFAALSMSSPLRLWPNCLVYKAWVSNYCYQLRGSNWRWLFLRNLLVCVMVTASFGQEPKSYKGKEEKLPMRVDSQPISFSHKKHATAGLPCQTCHADANSKDRAGIPNVEQCVLCHASSRATHPELKKLAEFDQRGQQVKWVRIYQVPHFVFFSHVNHLNAGEKCSACHGRVEQSDVLAREVSTRMNSCMSCHFSRKVSNECHLCHSLGQ